MKPLAIAISCSLAFCCVAAAEDAKPVDPVAEAMARERARLELARAALDATKAESEAKTAAAKADVGVVAARTATVGDVAAGDGAGLAEATLLSVEAAARASEAIKAVLGDRCRAGNRFVIVTGETSYQLGRLQAFRMRANLLHKSYANAMQLFDEAVTKKAEVDKDLKITGASAPPLPTYLGVAMEAFAGLASYFQSDYKFAKIDISPDNELLTSLVANKVIACGATPVLASRLKLDPTAIEAELLLLQIGNKDDSSQPGANDLRNRAETAAANETIYSKLAAEAKDPDKKEKLQAVSTAYAKAKTALTQAVTDFTNFLTGLQTADAKGELPLEKVSLESTIDAATKTANAYVLELTLKSSTGGTYTKKNLWTFFGSTPFYVAGTAVVNYTFVRPTDQQILATDVILVHEGYHSINDIPGRKHIIKDE